MPHFSRGSRGAPVRQLQEALEALGYPVGGVDGRYGPNTHKAVRAAAIGFLNAPQWPSEDPELGVEAAVVLSILDQARYMRESLEALGLWVVGRDWRKDAPAKARKIADLGITDAYLVINDAANRALVDHFHVFGDGAAGVETIRGKRRRVVRRSATVGGLDRALDTLAAALEAYEAAGVRAHVMSWLMPYREFVDDAAAALEELRRRRAPRSTMHDTEESWTRATPRGFATHTEAAAHVGEAFAGTGSHWITPYAGILNTSAIAELAELELVEGVALQCYATSSSRAKPGSVQKYGLKAWRRSRAKAAGCRLYMGGPLYRQKNSDGKGISARRSLRLQFDTARKAAEVRGYVNWASWDLKRGSAAVSFIREAAGAVTP